MYATEEAPQSSIPEVRLIEAPITPAQLAAWRALWTRLLASQTEGGGPENSDALGAGISQGVSTTDAQEPMRATSEQHPQ